MGANAANADRLNQYFAVISTDPDYSLSDVIHFYTPEDDLSTSSTFIDITPGHSAWLFKKCSVELADVVAKLISISSARGQVYAKWKTTLVTPPA